MIIQLQNNNSNNNDNDNDNNNLKILKLIYYVDLNSTLSNHIIKMILNSIEKQSISNFQSKWIQEFIHLIMISIQNNHEYGFLQYSYLLINLPLHSEATITTIEITLKVLFRLLKDYYYHSTYSQSCSNMSSTPNSTDIYLFAICGILKRNSTLYLETTTTTMVDINMNSQTSIRNEKISWLVSELLSILDIFSNEKNNLIRRIIFDILLSFHL